MRISDWSSDVCSSDLRDRGDRGRADPCGHLCPDQLSDADDGRSPRPFPCSAALRRRTQWCRRDGRGFGMARPRSEEHTSELQSLMRISYAVFCLKKKTNKKYNKDTATNE